MIADRRRLQLIFLMAGLSLSSLVAPFDRANADRGGAVSIKKTAGACAMNYQALAQELKPKPLVRAQLEEYDDMGNLTALAEAAKVMDIRRLRPATLFADLSDTSSATVLANLDDGIYVYGIDASNHLVMMPRNIIPASEILANPKAPSLGSHAGLMVVLQEKAGTSAQFVSTGEFVRRNGRVFAVDNKSGTFPGGSDSLTYGTKRLKAAGLEIDERTKIADASKFETSGAHAVAYEQVRIEAKVMADPVRRQLFEETKRIMKKADGKFDKMPMSTFLPAAMSDAAKNNASYFYDRWKLPSEGTAYIFEEVYGTRFNADPEAFKKMLKQVEAVVDAAK
ncbi:hypothetical protein BH10BDE1_BH10BDE1_26310 [soil metagenome]